MNIVQKSTPNYTQGRNGNSPEVIVVHWIVGHLAAADAVFANDSSDVSAHYGIEDTTVHQYVSENNTAWHCGDWLWNLKSIGIEHAGGPTIPITQSTYETSAQLIKEICNRWNIPIDRDHILPHSKFRATQCPGDLDIDKLISLATNSDCERELDEMRESRNSWKQKFYDIEQTLETEREDHAKIVREKNEQIESLQKQISTLSQNQVSDRKEIESLRKELKAKSEALESLQRDHNLYMAEKELEIEGIERSRQEYQTKLAKCMGEKEDLTKKLNQKIKNISWSTFIWNKLRG